MHGARVLETISRAQSKVQRPCKVLETIRDQVPKSKGQGPCTKHAWRWTYDVDLVIEQHCYLRRWRRPLTAVPFSTFASVAVGHYLDWVQHTSHGTHTERTRLQAWL